MALRAIEVLVAFCKWERRRMLELRAFPSSRRMTLGAIRRKFRLRVVWVGGRVVIVAMAVHAVGRQRSGAVRVALRAFEILMALC